jgi:hypothetical protein
VTGPPGFAVACLLVAVRTSLTRTESPGIEIFDDHPQVLMGMGTLPIHYFLIDIHTKPVRTPE